MSDGGGSQVRHQIGAFQTVRGDANCERVRAWFREHLCGTNRECAAAVGLSEYAVGRHVKKIRAEWTTRTNRAAESESVQTPALEPARSGQSGNDDTGPPCTQCDGTGLDDCGGPCPDCDGSGEDKLMHEAM